VLQASGILLGAEYVDLFVTGGSKGFEAFIALLSYTKLEVEENTWAWRRTVIQSRCHAMNSEVRILHELGLGPLAGVDMVARLDVTIYYEKLSLYFG
jgi:hypothetical protein